MEFNRISLEWISVILVFIFEIFPVIVWINLGINWQKNNEHFLFSTYYRICIRFDIHSYDTLSRDLLSFYWIWWDYLYLLRRVSSWYRLFSFQSTKAANVFITLLTRKTLVIVPFGDIFSNHLDWALSESLCDLFGCVCVWESIK